MGTIFYLLFLSLTLLFIFSIRTAIHENTKHGTLERRHPRGRNVLWCIRCHFPLLSAYLEYLLSDFPHDVPSVFFFSSVLCVRKSIGFESNNLWLASQLIHLKAMLRWDKLLHWASTSLSDISETPLLICKTWTDLLFRELSGMLNETVWSKSPTHTTTIWSLLPCPLLSARRVRGRRSQPKRTGYIRTISFARDNEHDSKQLKSQFLSGMRSLQSDPWSSQVTPPNSSSSGNAHTQSIETKNWKSRPGSPEVGSPDKIIRHPVQFDFS